MILQLASHHFSAVDFQVATLLSMSLTIRSMEPSELSSRPASMLRSASREGECEIAVPDAALVLLLLPLVEAGVATLTMGGL